MPVNYVAFEEARGAKGLRMVVVVHAPSPWGEAAKGILHVKQLPWKAVRLDPNDDDMAEWTGARSGPVALLDDEPPRSGWAEILLLAERLAPSPSLIPADPLDRAHMMGLSFELLGEDGLCWARRLASVHAGLNDEPGFPRPVAEYLGEKYGYRADQGPAYEDRVVELLGLFAGLLHDQKRSGHDFYLGHSLTALDLYSATAMALFKPLPPDQCPMAEFIRPGFESLSERTAKALDPILIEHRDFVYSEYLELPLTL